MKISVKQLIKEDKEQKYHTYCRALDLYNNEYISMGYFTKELMRTVIQQFPPPTKDENINVKTII